MVDVIGEVVSLVVIMTTHGEFNIWCFTLEHVNEQQQLVEHVNVVFRPRHLKQKKRYAKSKVMLECTSSLMGRIQCPPCNLSSPSDEIVPPLLMHATYISYYT